MGEQMPKFLLASLRLQQAMHWLLMHGFLRQGVRKNWHRLLRTIVL